MQRCVIRRAPWLSLVWILTLVVALFFPTVAGAASANPDNPTTLDVRNPSASGVLVGSRGGQYHYYRVGYQGGNAPVLFTVTYSPSWGSGNDAFGFNLYGPSGLTYSGHVTSATNNVGTAEYTLVNGAAMNLLVQIYNYSDGGAVSYTFTVSGLSGGSASTIVGGANATSSQAIPVNTINATLGGTIVGNSGGAFQYYTLPYPGGNSSLSVMMNAAPVYTGSGEALGFNLYRALPNGTTTLVATGSLTAEDKYSATWSATVQATASGNYQLQVFNYWAGVPVSYGITASGLAGQVIQASGNTDPGHAVVLNSAQAGATGTIVGNSGGAFNYYLVRYPGNWSTLSLSITYFGSGGASMQALGFKVYDGANLVATIVPTDDGSGLVSGGFTYSEPDAKTFGIQVYNYAPGTTATYTLYQVGAQ